MKRVDLDRVFGAPNRSRLIPARRRLLAMLVGLGAVAAYLGGGLISERLDPARRVPVLDGLVPPPPYRWVKPPATLAGTNQPPGDLHATLGLGASGSEIGAYATSDGQLNLLLLSFGVFPRASGQKSVALTIVPLAPAGFGPLGHGRVITGNVYRVEARYLPSGQAIPLLRGDVQLALQYPALAYFGFNRPKHLLYASSDGQHWHSFPTHDSVSGEQVSATVHAPGYYAVGLPNIRAATEASNSSKRTLVLSGLVVAVVLAGAYGFTVWHRRRRLAGGSR